MQIEEEENSRSYEKDSSEQGFDINCCGRSRKEGSETYMRCRGRCCGKCEYSESDCCVGEGMCYVNGTLQIHGDNECSVSTTYIMASNTHGKYYTSVVCNKKKKRKCFLTIVYMYIDMPTALKCACMNMALLGCSIFGRILFAITLCVYRYMQQRVGSIAELVIII